MSLSTDESIQTILKFTIFKLAKTYFTKREKKMQKIYELPDIL